MDYTKPYILAQEIGPKKEKVEKIECIERIEQKDKIGRATIDDATQDNAPCNGPDIPVIETGIIAQSPSETTIPKDESPLAIIQLHVGNMSSPLQGTLPTEAQSQSMVNTTHNQKLPSTLPVKPRPTLSQRFVEENRQNAQKDYNGHASSVDRRHSLPDQDTLQPIRPNVLRSASIDVTYDNSIDIEGRGKGEDGREGLPSRTPSISNTPPPIRRDSLSVPVPPTQSELAAISLRLFGTKGSSIKKTEMLGRIEETDNKMGTINKRLERLREEYKATNEALTSLAMSPEDITALRTKLKQERRDGTESLAPSLSSTNSSEAIVCQVWRENHRIAAMVHKQSRLSVNGEVEPWLDIYVMHRIQELSIYRENIASCALLRPTFMKYIKAKLLSRKALEMELRGVYRAKMEAWRDQLNADAIANRAKLMKARAYFEKEFPDMKQPKHDYDVTTSIQRALNFGAFGNLSLPAGRTRRASRIGGWGDVVRSDAEMEQVLEDLLQQDRHDANRYQTTAAVIPGMILDRQVREKCRYIDTNGLLTDLPAVAAEHKSLIYWDHQEKQIFLDKYLQHPKNFTRIAVHLPGKTTNDCVAYYYASKHTRKYKALVQQNMVNKRRRLTSDQVADFDAVKTPVNQRTDMPAANAKTQPRSKAHKANQTESEGVKETASWQVDEIELASQLLRKHGRSWGILSREIGTKTEAQCKNFYHNYKRRLNLDALIDQYEAQIQREAEEAESTNEQTPKRKRKSPSSEELVFAKGTKDHKRRCVTVDTEEGEGQNSRERDDSDSHSTPPDDTSRNNRRKRARHRDSPNVTTPQMPPEGETISTSGPNRERGDDEGEDMVDRESPYQQRQRQQRSRNRLKFEDTLDEISHPEGDISVSTPMTSPPLSPYLPLSQDAQAVSTLSHMATMNSVPDSSNGSVYAPINDRNTTSLGTQYTSYSQPQQPQQQLQQQPQQQQQQPQQPPLPRQRPMPIAPPYYQPYNPPNLPREHIPSYLDPSHPSHSNMWPTHHDVTARRGQEERDNTMTMTQEELEHEVLQRWRVNLPPPSAIESGMDPPMDPPVVMMASPAITKIPNTISNAPPNPIGSGPLTNAGPTGPTTVPVFSLVGQSRPLEQSPQIEMNSTINPPTIEGNVKGEPTLEMTPSAIALAEKQKELRARRAMQQREKRKRAKAMKELLQLQQHIHHQGYEGQVQAKEERGEDMNERKKKRHSRPSENTPYEGTSLRQEVNNSSLVDGEDDDMDEILESSDMPSHRPHTNQNEDMGEGGEDAEVEEAGRRARRSVSYWTTQEKEDFLNHFKIYGRNWNRLSELIPSKTQNQIKNYFQNYKNKLNLNQVLEQSSALNPDDPHLHVIRRARRGTKTLTNEIVVDTPVTHSIKSTKSPLSQFAQWQRRRSQSRSGSDSEGNVTDRPVEVVPPSDPPVYIRQPSMDPPTNIQRNFESPNNSITTHSGHVYPPDMEGKVTGQPMSGSLSDVLQSSPVSYDPHHANIGPPLHQMRPVYGQRLLDKKDNPALYTQPIIDPSYSSSNPPTPTFTSRVIHHIDDTNSNGPPVTPASMAEERFDWPAPNQLEVPVHRHGNDNQGYAMHHGMYPKHGSSGSHPMTPTSFFTGMRDVREGPHYSGPPNYMSESIQRREAVVSELY
eukprot:Ihof_evm2s116 gene=Ihof_evmTU2s116